MAAIDVMKEALNERSELKNKGKKMKLIDLLLTELPKHGGWPGGAHCANNTNGLLSWDYFGCGRIIRLDASKLSFGIETVTKEEFEAALADKNATAWNGEGLPPVGCECEIHNRGEWIAVKIKFIGDKFVVAEPIEGRNEGLYENSMDGEGCYEIADEPERFRQFRTESDRKRNAASKEMARHANNDYESGFAAGLRNCLSIYDAISAGKIPGVKLED